MLCRLASGGGLRAPRLPARACAGTWQQRCNATTDPSPPPSPKPAAKGVAALLLQTGADAVLRGVGQVVFCNSPLAGVGMLAALGLGGGPALLFGAGAGTAVATASSALCGLDASARAAGLHGYNGCLVGCAFAVFLPMASYSLLAVALATAAGSAVSPLLATAIGQTTGRVPQWTLAFNGVALTSLLHAKPFFAASADAAIADNVTAVTATVAEVVMKVTVPELLLSPLVGVSQIFVVDSSLAGALILASVCSYSPLCALSLFAGSTTGSLVGLALGADCTEVAHGLWGFNSALSSLAVSVFFVPSRESLALSFGGAAATSVAFAGLKGALAVVGAPALTLPFCAVASACYLLEGKAAGLSLAKEPHSPEQNAVQPKL